VGGREWPFVSVDSEPPIILELLILLPRINLLLVSLDSLELKEFFFLFSGRVVVFFLS
jgi:hypothetical protein